MTLAQLPCPPAGAPAAYHPTRRSTVALVLLGPVVAAGAALVGLGGTWALVARNVATDDPWDQLGAAIVLLLIGLPLTAGLYVLGVVIGVLRLRPRGERATAMTVLLMAPVLLVAMLAAGFR